MKRTHIISKGKEIAFKTCDINNYFGIALKEIRIKKGLTQEKAAELLSVTQAQWSLYESGKNKPNLDTIIEISSVLEEDPFDLIGLALSKSKYFTPSQDVKSTSRRKSTREAPKAALVTSH